MYLIEPGSKEEAVLDAIIAVRLNNENDIFEYDCKEVQSYLNQIAVPKGLIITLDAQRDIVMDLSKKRILSIDQIVDNRYDNMFHLNIDPYCVDVLHSRPDFSWANQTDWAYEKLQENGRISIGDAYAKYGDKIFIKMTSEDIENINYNCRASHEVQLAFDRKNPHLCIKIEDGNWKCISRLDAKQSPYLILKYAFLHPGKQITRSELSEKKIVTESRSLISQVFSDNNSVKALIPLMLEIDSDSIIFRRNVKTTLREVNRLKAIFKIK